MRLHRLFSYWLGLLCLVAVAWFWLRVHEDETKRNATDPSANTPRIAFRFPSSATAPKTGIGGQPAPGKAAAAALAPGGIARTGAAAPNARPAAGSPPSRVP